MQAYVSETYWLADEVVRGCDEIFDAAPAPKEPGKSYYRVDPALHQKIRHVLGAASRLRALLAHRSRRKSQSKAVFELQQERIDWLRNQVLREVKLDHLLDAGVRHSLEHFDEYLDETAHGTSTGKMALPAIVLMAMVAGDRAVVAQTAMRSQLSRDGVPPSICPLRVYYADERVFQNCTRTISVGAIRNEAAAIRDAIGNVPDNHDGRRAGAMLLLGPKQ